MQEHNPLHLLPQLEGQFLGVSRKPPVPTFVIREVVLHWAHRQLLLEAIDLVQEQDDTGLCEPPRVADAIKQGKCLLHTVD